MKDWIRNDFEGLPGKRASFTQSVATTGTYFKKNGPSGTNKYLDKIRPKNDADFY